MNLIRFTLHFITLHNLVSCVLSDVNNQLSDNIDKGVLYGYQDGDITQGVGYGHYLHPFYYQGASKKYYKCAVEDDWKPLSSDNQSPTTVDSNQHLRKPQKNHFPVKKYQYLDEKVKKKVFIPDKNLDVMPLRSPREKSYDPATTNKHYRIQNRNDFTVFGEEKLQRDHAKLVNDINSLSEYQPFLKKYREHDQILALESDNEQHISIAENPMEEDIINDGSHTDMRHISGYKVHENPIENPIKLHNVPIPQRFSSPSSKMPFQNYKKFKIISVKPSSVINLKYSGGPNKNVVGREETVSQQNVLQDLNKDAHPYPFISPTSEGSLIRPNRYYHRPQYEVPLSPMKFRQGRNNHYPVPITRHPRLTLLEQFLLLFPRMIR